LSRFGGESNDLASCMSPKTWLQSLLWKTWLPEGLPVDKKMF
jgi:hypothetical protein